MYKIDLAPDQYDAAYEILSMSDPPPPVDQWTDYISLLRKFRSVGQPGEMKGQVQVYHIAPDGIAHLELERAEIRIFRDRILKPVWLPHALEKAAAMRDLLNNAKDENGVGI